MSDGEWTILTRSSTGAVSLLQGLTEQTAREVMQRLLPESNPWSDDRIREQARMEATGQHLYGQSAGALSQLVGYNTYQATALHVDCWSASGQKLEVWPKPDDYDERLEKALATARKARDINARLAAKRAA